MKILKIAFPIGIIIAIIVAMVMYAGNFSIDVLQPKGVIAEKQRDLIVIATLLMLIVVIPVFVMTFAIAWKYREGSRTAKYRPEWDHSKIAETIWWGVPLAIIVALSVIIVRSSHELDPYKALASDVKPVRIQVVALQWKWLFIYPEHDIATVNFIQIPEDTPIDFEITADAPMNSFWIPSLGGQVYAMAGMETQLHLVANEPGEYKGSSANISGEGFAGMKFNARASTKADYDKWIASAQDTKEVLSQERYAKLAAQSKNDAPRTFGAVQKDLYGTIVMKYMTPKAETNTVDLHDHE